MDNRTLIWWLELGTEPYDRVWEMQHRLVAARQANRIPDTVILLEHEPVITMGRRAEDAHIVASPERLAQEGAIVRRIERGGDVTYHGPGQLVGYPILRMLDHVRGASDYMHALEEVLIRTLADFSIQAYRRKKLIGVWTERGKVAALGTRIKRGISFHGFALNVDPIMAHFQLIVPCGLNEPVTSMRQVLGEPVPMNEVRGRVRHRFREVFGTRLEPMGWEAIVPSLE
jgi:lipoate-protein ligase B